MGPRRYKPIRVIKDATLARTCLSSPGDQRPAPRRYFSHLARPLLLLRFRRTGACISLIKKAFSDSRHVYCGPVVPYNRCKQGPKVLRRNFVLFQKNAAPAVCLTLVWAFCAVADAQTDPNDVQPFPVLTGATSYFTRVTGGVVQDSPSTSPLLLYPFGDKWLLEA